MGQVYDLIIVGAGPAGLAAGIYAGERKLNTLILEANKPGGQPATLYPHKYIYDYPALSSITAYQLAQAMVTQAQRFGVEIKAAATVAEIVVKQGKGFQLITAQQNQFSAKSVLLAVGMGFFRPRRLNIPGEELAGVYHVFPAPAKLVGQRVLCVGGGETALEGALTAAKAGARKVYLVHRREEFRGVEKTIEELKKKGVEFLTPCELVEIRQGKGSYQAVVVNKKTQASRAVEVDLICIHIGFIPDSSLVERWGLEVKQRAVVVDREMQTSKAGIFACGDVTIPQGEYKRITIAQGQAAQAVHGIYKFLRQPYWG